MTRGKFITVEGIEGVGKTTNIAFLKQAIEEHGFEVLTSREPGGTPLAERIRDVLIEHGGEPLPDLAELLLMFAARSVHIENLIRPALAARTWVVLDRFTDASRAYQGGGRGIEPSRIEQLADWVHGDLRPDRTILLDAPVEVGLARAGRRSDPDRIEAEQAEFFARVRATYLDLAQREPKRFVVIDATGDLEEIRAAMRRIVADLVD